MGEESRPQLVGINIVEVGFYVQEEGRDVKAGLLYGADFICEGGNRVRQAETRERATLVGVEEPCVPG